MLASLTSAAKACWPTSSVRAMQDLANIMATAKMPSAAPGRKAGDCLAVVMQARNGR